MTIRETAIAKLQQLPESLLQEVIDFIDLTTRNHQAETVTNLLEGDRSEAWAQWFETTDRLELAPDGTPSDLTSEYQQRVLSKYRQQGLTL